MADSPLRWKLINPSNKDNSRIKIPNSTFQIQEDYVSKSESAFRSIRDRVPFRLLSFSPDITNLIGRQSDSRIWNLESGIWNLESGIWNSKHQMKFVLPNLIEQQI